MHTNVIIDLGWKVGMEGGENKFRHEKGHHNLKEKRKCTLRERGNFELNMSQMDNFWLM
jgi:hypothetical protein